MTTDGRGGGGCTNPDRKNFGSMGKKKWTMNEFLSFFFTVFFPFNYKHVRTKGERVEKNEKTKKKRKKVTNVNLKNL